MYHIIESQDSVIARTSGIQTPPTDLLYSVSGGKIYFHYLVEDIPAELTPYLDYVCKDGEVIKHLARDVGSLVQFAGWPIPE